jgi:hypothetical protein
MQNDPKTYTDNQDGAWHFDTCVVTAQEAAYRTGLAGSDVELLTLLSGPRSKVLVARADDVFVDLEPLLGPRATLTLGARIRP